MDKIALELGEFCGPGPLGLCDRTDGSEAPGLFNNVISTSVAIISIIAAIWFIFVLITGATALISSEGDSKAVETAKKKVTTGLIGLVVVIAAIFLVDLVGTILGIDILNPAEFILNYDPSNP